jgi:phosphatidylinositol glycan class W
MDLGVGSFVYTQGLVSAIPLLKDPNYLSEPLLSKIAKTTRKSLPIILLGIARVVLVKGTQYPVTYPVFTSLSLVLKSDGSFKPIAF